MYARQCECTECNYRYKKNTVKLVFDFYVLNMWETVGYIGVPN